jgi:hypothetical protein
VAKVFLARAEVLPSTAARLARHEAGAIRLPRQPHRHSSQHQRALTCEPASDVGCGRVDWQRAKGYGRSPRAAAARVHAGDRRGPEEGPSDARLPCEARSIAREGTGPGRWGPPSPPPAAP